MRSIKLLFFAIALTTTFISAQTTLIPDANFEQSLIDIGVDTNGLTGDILNIDAEAVTDLNLNNPVFDTSGFENPLIVNVFNKISDLSGIEAFVNLVNLQVSYGNFSTVNLSQNTLLEELFVNDGILTSIDVTNNTLLSVFGPMRNSISGTVDLSQNIALTTVFMHSNNISQIITGASPNLSRLAIQDNNLSSIDLSGYTGLTYITCYLNNFTDLDFSANLILERVRAGDNQLEELDLSVNTDVFEVLVANNNLVELDLSYHSTLNRLNVSNNQLISFNVKNGNNLAINAPWRFNTTNNPNLNCITVDDAVWSAATWTNIDGHTSFNSACPDVTYIPDHNFEQALIDIGFDSDGMVNTQILTSDAEAVTSLNLNNPFFDTSSFANPLIVNVTEKIADLTGIKAFINITNLQASHGEFATVDLSQNVLLEELFISIGLLTTIDVTNQPALRRFGAFTNNISGTIDLSQNTSLEQVYLSSNNISEINTGVSPNLNRLAIQDNNLTAIDLSGYTGLTFITCYLNNFTDIDFSSNLLLERVRAGDNQLAELDLSVNTDVFEVLARNNNFIELDLSPHSSLNRLDVSDNPLIRLNVKNGNNLAISAPWRFNTANNPNLNCITVDDPVWSAANWTNIDGHTSFNLACPDVTFIPDPNFEQKLIDLGVDSDGSINTQILTSEALAQTGSLDVCCSGISDLTGVEAFVNITELQAGLNNLTEIDVSQNTALTEIWVNYNQLTSLDVANNTLLEILSMGRNQITSIDLSNLNNLHTLRAWQNQLASIDVSNNPLLSVINVDENLLSDIDVTNNPILDVLSAHTNSISTLDVSQNPDLTFLNVRENELFQIDISSNSIIDKVIAQDNAGLKLITTPITGSPSLTLLNLGNTGLNNFNPTLYPNLSLLKLDNNSLSKLTTTNLPNLQRLFLNQNQLGSLDLSSNPLLLEVDVDNNELSELNVNNGNNGSLAQFDASNNLLTCITVDNADDANVNLPPYDTWVKDIGVTYSLDCTAEPEVILIPDTNFEAVLINAGHDTNGVVGSILKSDAETVLNLDASSAGISDLTGIQGFINLTDLNVSNNSLSNINLMENTNLINLNVANNNLGELFVNSGRDLETLNCSQNQISTLNLSDLTDLTAFNGSWNMFNAIDATAHGLLTSFEVNNNVLTALDIRNGNNGSIAAFNATNNPGLLCIAVDDENNVPGPWLKDIATAYSNDPDCIPPVIVAQPVTIYLDSKGNASVDPSDFDNGSNDDVSLNEDLIFSIDIADFDCSNLGANNVELTVTDEAGNSDSATVQVIVEDNIAPSVTAYPSLSHDLSGNAAFSITVADAHKSSGDNCGDPGLSLDQTLFTSPGIYTVTLTATDSSGNTAEDTTEVEIEDSAASTDLKFKKNVVLTIFPVPFTDVINIIFSKPTDLNTVSVVLLDFNAIDTGISFSPNGGGLISDSTSGLAQGSYVLQITVGNETKTVIIVK